jgi:hypothetical protein
MTTKQIEELDGPSANEAYDNGFEYGSLASYDRALSDVIETLEADTDPNSWGAFALPKVREVIAKLRAENK